MNQSNPETATNKIHGDAIARAKKAINLIQTYSTEESKKHKSKAKKVVSKEMRRKAEGYTELRNYPNEMFRQVAAIKIKYKKVHLPSDVTMELATARRKTSECGLVVVVIIFKWKEDIMK